MSPPRIVRALLRLYPSRHRERYGEEMWEVTEHRWRRSGGSVGATIAAAWGLLTGAIGVWRDELGKPTAGAAWGWGLDARFVARSLWRSRGYVATAVLVLASAVAVNATVFSYVRGTLLSEPPYPDPASVMIVWGSNGQEGQLRDVVSGPSFIDLQEQTTALDPVAAMHQDGVYMMVDGRPEVLGAMEVTVDFLDVLQVRPALGRFFDERDRYSGAAETVVVTHAFWRDRLDSDPAAVGTTLPFARGAREVIGVLPEGFEFLSPVPLFVPLRDDVLAAEDPGHIYYHVLGRLVPGASVLDVNADLAPVMADMTRRFPGYEGWSFLAEPLHRVSVEAVRPVIWILTATVALVLLVALANLATLFHIRALARADELSLRAALGAGRTVLLRVLLMETVGLATAGALLGLAATPFLLDGVSGLLPTWVAIPDSAARVPVLQSTLDPVVAAVAVLGALLGSLALTAPSLASVLGAANTRVAAGSRVLRGVRGTRLLVGFELAAATVLCIGAALTARSAGNLLSEDLGVEVDGLLTVYFAEVWDLEPPERVAYFRRVVAEVEQLPGVERAGVIGYIDFEAEDDYARVYFLGRELQPVRDQREEWRRIDEGFFSAAGTPMVRGTAFETADFEGDPRAAIVNEAFAAKHYPAGDALGSRVSLTDEGYDDLEVVGVVRDVRSLGPAAPPPAMIYVPYQADPRGTLGMYVRVAGDPMSFAAGVREAIWSVDSSEPIIRVTPMRDLVEQWVAIPRATRALVLTLAVLASLLSALGVFGVVAYALKTRRAELGIRLALGATPDRLEADQLRAIGPVLGLGVGLGLLVGIAAARAARVILYGVEPADPVSLGAAVVAISVAGLVATYLPARRAARISPTEMIRSD